MCVLYLSTDVYIYSIGCTSVCIYIYTYVYKQNGTEYKEHASTNKV